MAHNDKLEWNEDWESFVRRVGQSFDRGLDNRAVTELFAGRQVIWVGKVTGKRLDGDRPGIKLQMPLVVFEMSDGKRGSVDYLFVHLNAEDIASWEGIELGSSVRFQTAIDGANGIFPGIRWVNFKNNRGTIMLGAHGAVALA
jgi:hypothetical protein